MRLKRKLSVATVFDNPKKEKGGMEKVANQS